MAKLTQAVWWAGAIVVLAGVGVLPLRHCSEAWQDADARDRDFDAEARSVDLDADLRLMWQTAPLDSDPASEASTLAAIMAASRVFNTVSLVGKTGAQAKALLGSPTRSSRSVYRGQPFGPLRARGMIYRFDCGRCGWQFNVYCEGDEQLVTEVERMWIH